MDKQSEEWGGEATFFSGKYKKYSWSRIFDPKLGGFELINIYGEALIQMNQNPNIPQLFRDIFKNAYLPYRDPETLKSFLKEINEFKYDHSEQLGNAYEYLLSVLSSQGDAGQFRYNQSGGGRMRGPVSMNMIITFLLHPGGDPQTPGKDHQRFG